MTEERVLRRLAAVLAADVVGYSRLMGQDESGTLTALKARRKDVLEPLVGRYQGRIFKLMGDGVLVEFGSAVNAVQGAVELQHCMAAANAELPEVRRIVLRIGVNLGDVIVEGGDLYGDASISRRAFKESQNRVTSSFRAARSTTLGTRSRRTLRISAFNI
jgi:adenylate cyclase